MRNERSFYNTTSEEVLNLCNIIRRILFKRIPQHVAAFLPKCKHLEPYRRFASLIEQSLDRAEQVFGVPQLISGAFRFLMRYFSIVFRNLLKRYKIK